jgi:signal transduction histidine kinase
VPGGPNGPGIVLIVLRMETFIRSVLGPFDRMLNLRFTDLAGTVPLFDDLPAGATPAFSTAIDFGMRRYCVQTTPTAAYLMAHRGWQSWIVLVSGVLSTGLLGALLLLATGQSYRLQRLVDQRTRDLRSTNERLKLEITERQQAEGALHQARRMEAIGQLSGGIAHDFNNLLMIVGGNVERLRSKLSNGDTIRFLDMIESAVSRGENLTRRLLAFAQRRPLRPSVIDVVQLIRDAAEMLGRSLRGNIEIKTDLRVEECYSEVDASELELAILNLAVNAQDAMPAGGILTLSVNLATLGANASMYRLEGEYVVVNVVDTGIGIPADLLDRVFEPFFTTKEVGKGTGLGLSHVYGFAKQSGGGVTISSMVGHGTTVTLYLPSVAKTPNLANSLPRPALSSSGQARARR